MQVKKLYKILPIIILLFLNNLFAQDVLQKQYNYALNLFENENYFESVTEFKRLLFFDTNNQHVFEANKFIGQSYKMGGKFSEALYHFNRAVLNTMDEEKVFEIKIEIVRVNILRRTINPALNLLENLDEKYITKKDDINYWRGWAYIFADEWDKASEAFAKIDSSSQLKIIADEVENEKYSITLAKVLSYIVPGAGQIYTGNYVSGILSLGWNFLWGYLTINAFIEDRVFDGIMVANFLWLRFYRGNIQNAEKFAREKNIEISNKALHFLQHEFQGLKP